MLRTLLVQVLNRYPKVFEHFQEEDQYKLHKEKTSWTYEMLWRVYRRIATDENMEQICLIIDAMGTQSCSVDLWIPYLRICIIDQTNARNLLVRISLTGSRVFIHPHMSNEASRY